MLKTLKAKFEAIIRENCLESEDVRIVGRVSNPLGKRRNPDGEADPLQRGKERLMQAVYGDSTGEAYTDMCGNFEGKISRVLGLDLTNNFRRAVFVSTVNAVMKDLGMANGTCHCRDRGPANCCRDLVDYIKKEFGHPKIALVGLQPRMLEALSYKFKVRVTDLDEDNIGVKKFGIRIGPPQRSEADLEWCDIALVTGTTLVNDTIDQFNSYDPLIFYGTTIAGPARLLGLKRFCPYSQ